MEVQFDSFWKKMSSDKQCPKYYLIFKTYFSTEGSNYVGMTFCKENYHITRPIKYFIIF